MEQFNGLFEAIRGVVFNRHTMFTSSHQSKHNRRKTGLSLVLLWVLALSTTAIALAVHNGALELDGNAVNDSAEDWVNIYNGGGSAQKSHFIDDGINKVDVTYFTGGGSKDVNDIDQWNYSSNDQTPDKDKLTNAYAAIYDVDGQVTLYFGADRYANNGNAQIGFWFFQNKVETKPDGRFTGTHEIGDLLVLSDFVTGGQISEIRVYQWIGASDPAGPLKEIVSIPNGDCENIPVGDDHDVCATVNKSDGTVAPWPYNPKTRKSEGLFPAGSFFEGGINLSAFGFDKEVCSFLVETRSSDSVDATLKDFALGPLNDCSPPPQNTARLTLTPEQSAARVGVTQTFTVKTETVDANGNPSHVNGVTVTAALANTTTPDAITFPNSNTCTTQNDGTCTLSITSSAPNKTTLQVSASVPVNGTSSTETDEAGVRWVDALVTIQEPAADQSISTGTPFDITVKLDFDTGEGNQWQPASGQPISISGTAIPEPLSCGPTDANGTCTLTLPPLNTPGTSIITATWAGAIDTTEGVVPANNADFDAVTVRGVGAQLELSPELAANQIGANHQLTARLQYNDGLSFTPIVSQTVDFKIVSGPGAPAESNCTTTADGSCTVSFTSGVTGTSMVSATWSGDILIDGTPVPASAGDTAKKVWVDVRLSLEPTVAAALAGQPQPVTARIEVDSGSGFAAPISASGPVSVTISSGPGALSGSPCDFAGSQSCQVSLTSANPGLTELSATWSGAVEVQPGVMAQAGAGPASARHRWVDAVLSLDPESAGGVTSQSHVMTATLKFDTGSGLLPTTSLTKTKDITFTLGGVGSLSSPNCIEAGTCLVTLESTEYGTSTVTATWSGTIDTGEGNVPATLSDVATKNWFDLRVTIGEPFADEAECTDLDPVGFNPNNSVTDLLIDPNMEITPANLNPLNQLTPNATQFSRLCNDEDFDFYWVDIADSSFITITLSGMETDYDVAVYVLPQDFDASGADSPDDALALVQLQNYADVDSVGRMSSGRMSSGRMSSGRMSSGRMSSGRMSSGRMSSGRMSSGRMSSGSDLSGAVDEQTVAFVEGGQRVFVAVFSGVGAYGPQYALNLQTRSGDQGIGKCSSNLPSYRLPNSGLPGYSTAPMGSGSPKTLILTHLGRLEARYGSAAATNLINRLQAFTVRGEINGLIVPVESNPAVEAAYAAWNNDYCSIGAANAVAKAIKANIIKAYPMAEYIVIAGSHEVIPFRQVPDYVTISPEGDYLDSSQLDPGNPLFWTLFNSWISTDDFYADETPNLFRGRELYVPDKPIGRLVESPAEMITVIGNYENAGGQSNINTCMVTGYEFLSDSAAAIDSQLTKFGLTPKTLNNDFWTKANLNNIWSTGPGLVSVNAHFEHYRLLPALAGNQNQLYYSGDLPNNIAHSVNYSVGCHAGFNVPDGFTSNTNAKLDFPQAFAQRGAAAWVANTGYGYGDDEAIADSELLTLFLTQELGRASVDGVSTGQALVAAKQRFVSNFSADAFGLFEEKSMIEATLFGLPMHQVIVPDSQAIASLTTDLAPLTKLPGLASLDSTHTLVSREAPQRVSASLNSQTHLADFTNALTEQVTPRGRYFTLGGPDQVQVIPNQPLQPKESVVLNPVDGRPARGALLLNASFTDLPDFDPVISIPMSDTTILEPAFSLNGWFPDRPWEINRLGSSPHLMLVPGQYNASGRTERKYIDMAIEVYYSDDPNDFHSPGIWKVKSACSGNNPVEFSIKTDDAAGIARALVTYQQGNSWQSLNLNIGPQNGDGSYPASGSLALPAETPYFVQVLDNAGNVTVETNKGRMYKTCIDQPNATNNLQSDSSTHAITVRLEKNQGDGWQPVPGAQFDSDFVNVENGQIVSNTCALVTGTDGECEVRITNNTAGFTTITITPIVTVTVDGESYQLKTGFEGANGWRGRYVKEWWSGSISLFKKMESGSAKVCFTLARAGGNFAPNQKCVDVNGSHTFVWDGLPTGSDYTLTEDSATGGYLTMQPNPLTGIEVNDANRNVVLRTETNRLPGNQGCTPGYWKNHLERWSQTSLTPEDKFSQLFGVNGPGKGNLTLAEALNLGGGGKQKLARHGVAALLNAIIDGVNFPYSPAQVIKMVAAGMNGNGEPQATQLANANELGCPLN